MEVEWGGERIVTKICPAKSSTPEIVDLFRQHRFAGGNLTLTEQSRLTAPFLEAWDLITTHLDAAQAERIKKSGKS